jgi:hypothetical protein
MAQGFKSKPGKAVKKGHQARKNAVKKRKNKDFKANLSGRFRDD